MKISLACDIDGVLNDQMGFFDRIADRYGITDRSYRDSYNGIYKSYCPDNNLLADLIFEEHLEEFLLDSKPFEGARKNFGRFVNNDNINTYIVTSRKQENRGLTHNWLNKNGFTGQIDTLYMDSKLNSPCQVLIDDHVKHLQDFASNARMAVCMKRSYNRDYNGTHKVSNLKQAYELLMPFL